MKHMTRIGMLSGALLLCIASNPVPALAATEQTKQLMIAEISPEAIDTGTKEYVVVYNPNTIDTDVTGWMLQYRSASHVTTDTKSWSTKAVMGCNTAKTADCEALSQTIIKAGQMLRLSSYETEAGIVPMSSGMATSGGEVRLVQPGEGSSSVTVHDKVGYGTAADFEGTKPAVAPKAGRSIVRVQDATGAYTDTDHNDADFMLTADEDTDNSVAGGQPGGNTPGRGAGPLTYLDAEITEVLPDPASPKLDSADEFIELYNPYGESLDLTGYALKTGQNWTHTYTVGEVVIEPYDYVVLMSAQTHLSLSNTGSGVRLYDPAGRLVVEVPSYSKAQTGNSWVRDASGQWVWTTKPTPAEQNIIETPPTPTPKESASSPTKAAAKTTSTSKKSSAPKTTGAVKGLTTTASQAAEVPATGGNQTGLWVLGGAAVLGAGYALFEYRRDIGSFVRRRWEGLHGLVRR